MKRTHCEGPCYVHSGLGLLSCDVYGCGRISTFWKTMLPLSLKMKKTSAWIFTTLKTSNPSQLCNFLHSSVTSSPLGPNILCWYCIIFSHIDRSNCSICYIPYPDFALGNRKICGLSLHNRHFWGCHSGLNCMFGL